MRKADPPIALKKKTQNKFGKTMTDKGASMSNKLGNAPPNDMNIHSTSKTSVTLLPLEYNIVDDMKKNSSEHQFVWATQDPE